MKSIILQSKALGLEFYLSFEYDYCAVNHIGSSGKDGVIVSMPNALSYDHNTQTIELFDDFFTQLSSLSVELFNKYSQCPHDSIIRQVNTIQTISGILIHCKGSKIDIKF